MAGVDPRTPVVVGVSEVVHRPGDSFTPASATAIILEAALAALGDTESGADLGPLVGEVLVPHGTWPDGDPARAVAKAIGAPGAASVRSELGLLQSSLMLRASPHRRLAPPYPRWLGPQMNVDQAAALIVTSVANATRLGIPRERWVSPLALAESSLVVTLPERPELHRWPACVAAGEAAFTA